MSATSEAGKREKEGNKRSAESEMREDGKGGIVLHRLGEGKLF